MRSTSNPAFRNLPSGGFGGGYAGFQTQTQPRASAPGYGGYAQPPTTAERPMTVDDVISKTLITVGVTLLTGVITAVAVLGGAVENPFPLVIGGMLVGLVLSLLVMFKFKTNVPMILGYAAAEGVFLGAITGVVEMFVSGVAAQALLGTGLVFGIMLFVYKTGAVKVTPRLTKWVMGAAMAAIALMLINLLAGGALGFRGENTGLSIAFSLAMIGIAAFMLLLNFDQTDQMIRAGMPAKFAWYAAFGLVLVLVWLYLEMLRLLMYLQGE